MSRPPSLDSDTRPRPRHRRLGSVVLCAIVTVLALVGTEFALRRRGRIPGYLPRYSQSPFKPAGDLQVSDIFLTDGEGVFKANPDHQRMRGYRINSEGFRSREFMAHPPSTPTILFLGDSFTWGLNAEPLNRCFVDMLDSCGYVTFNAGIPGTDPIQYSYLAEKYIPRLRPAVVATMFYLGNDIAPPRPMLRYKPLHHITNAGWLYAYDERGEYLSLEQAYDRQVALNNAAQAPTQPGTVPYTLHRFLTKTVVGTGAWVAGVRISTRLRPVVARPSQAGENPVGVETPRPGARARAVRNTRRCLGSIRRIAEEYGAAFALFIIPLPPWLTNEYNCMEANLDVFRGFHPFVPDFLTADDYVNPPDDHFNNSGHRKYAEFILRCVATLHECPAVPYRRPDGT